MLSNLMAPRKAATIRWCEDDVATMMMTATIDLLLMRNVKCSVSATYPYQLITGDTSGCKIFTMVIITTSYHWSALVFSYEVAFTDMWGRRFLRYTVTSYFSNVCASLSIDQHNENCDGYWFYYRSEYNCANSTKSLQYLKKWNNEVFTIFI